MSTEPLFYFLLGLIVLTMIGSFAWHRVVITRIAPSVAGRIVKALGPRHLPKAPSAFAPSPETVSRRSGVRGCFVSAVYEAVVALALSLPWLLLFVAILAAVSR